MLDPGTSHTVSCRPGERFAYCSTFTALAAGILLSRDTDRQLNYATRNDIAVAWPPAGSPVGIAMLSTAVRRTRPRLIRSSRDATEAALAALG